MSDVIIGHKGSLKTAGEVLIKAQARRQHAYLVGKTGTGKSTLLKNMAVQDIRSGQGVAVIDPHGDLVEDILNFIPKSRIKEVIYLNPADLNFPAGLNILEVRQKQEKQLVASSLISVFRHIFRDSWGVRTEYVLFNAVMALMDFKGSTLLDVYRLFIDSHFREAVIGRIQDPIVKLYWSEVFGNYEQQFASEVVSPIQNKVGQLLAGSYLRNIVGQPKSTFDLRHLIDHRQILLANLSKGRIGEDRANLLGSVLITKLYLAALERQDTNEELRRDFYLYVDEFQNFSTDAFPSILSEARKYRLNLTLVHQYLDQLPENLQRSVFGNVGTWVVFRVGTNDGLLLEKEFAPYFDTESLNRLENFEAIYKTLRGGKSTDPSFLKTFPPATEQGSEAKKETVIKVSRQRYAKSREVVEEKINERLRL